MILADLPYGTTASNWDKAINSQQLWEQYERLISPQGAIVLFASGQFTNKLINSNPKLYRYKWVWVKSRTGNFVNAKNRPLTHYEELLVFSKGITANTKHTERKMHYYPQGLVKKNTTYEKTSTNKFGSMIGERVGHKKVFKSEYKNYPTDVLNYNSVGKPVHPTEKPLDLLEYLIKTYTKPGDTVLDNCMGSGTTGMAAVHTGRKFIGIELDDKYYQLASERINNTTYQERIL